MLSDSKQKQLYTDMVTSRIFDEIIERKYDEGESFPHFHSGIGQEALMVAPIYGMEEHDELIYTHRGYGHLFARGVPPRKVLSDMLFKATGTNGGFGGVMHVCDPERGIVGRNGVFGSRFTIASGLAFSKQYKREDSVVVCYYGEAAGTRGPLFEAMNLMSLWNLPVVLIAENNGFSISTRTEEIYAPGDMSTYAEGFDIPREVIDGNDVNEVYSSVDSAITRARTGNGPTVIEGETYRISGHKLYDPEDYRDADEVERWRENDPIRRYEESLLENSVVTKQELERIRVDIRDQLDEIFESVPNDPEPSPEQAFDYIYRDRRVEQ